MKANLELIEQVRSLMGQFPRLRLLWVRGHSGIRHNERADELASAALARSA